MKNPAHFLSLIIPSYKQEKTILVDLQKILVSLEDLKYDFELILVIDGEIDQTKAILKKARLPKVKVVSYRENQGKAFAIRQGFKVAQGDYIMFLDAGGEIDPDGISMLIEHMDWYEADIVIGSKRHPASKVNYPLKRKIYSQGYYYLSRILFNLKVRDTQAGIKVFSKKTLTKILPLLVEKRFAGDLEFLVAAKKNGFNNICEAPIKMAYGDDQFSSAIKLSSVVGIFVDTMAIFYRANILKFYNKPHRKNEKIEVEIFES